MSRIGKSPIEVPAKTKIAVSGGTVAVEGPKGKLAYTFPKNVKIVVTGNTVNIERVGEDRQSNAQHGTTRALIANMLHGVLEGYSKDIVIKGVGFRAAMKGGKTLTLNLGYSHPIDFQIPEGIKITVGEEANTKNPTVKIEGCDKQLVGAVAAELKHYYKPEPYKGKGVHIVGEVYRRKEGKKAG
jgi:large subunit ribosomal protein L6